MAETKSTTAANRNAEAKPESTNETEPTNQARTPNLTDAKGAAEDPTTANPTVHEGDRLAPGATTSGNSAIPNGTGFHCGVCGRPVGKQGEHYDEDGDQVETPHATTMVVADDWAEKQDEQDQEAADKHAQRKAGRRARAGQ